LAVRVFRLRYPFYKARLQPEARTKEPNPQLFNSSEKRLARLLLLLANLARREIPRR